MKNKKRLLLITPVVVIALITGYLLIQYNNYINKICNIDIMNYDTTGISIEKLNDYFQTELPYSVNDLDLKDAITYDFSKQQTTMIDISFIEYLKKDYSNIDLTPSCKVDNEKLSLAIDYYNEQAANSINAKIIKKNNTYSIKKEVCGSIINKDKFIKTFNAHIKKNGYITKDLALSDFYIQPSVTSEDLKDIIEVANKCSTWSVTYNNGSKYTAELFKDVIIKDSTLVFNDDFLDNVTSEVYDSYTKIGEPKQFKTFNGDDIIVSGGTLGTEVDKMKEKKALMEAFHKGKSLKDRTPIYTSKLNGIGNTYIEVSIEAQHCWVYKDGNLLMNTDVVTGTSSKHDTPTGVYYISERINGKYLKGENYKTWVNKWMRLTGNGIGLHDASWRSSFGNTIYKSSGSHGCINLPKQFAYDLYDNTYVGMPVVIY